MRIEQFSYSPLDVVIVTLDPNEVFGFTQEAVSKSYGTFKLTGDSWGHTGPTGETYYTQPHAKWQPNDETGFSNDAVGHTLMKVTAGPEGATWLCLSRNSTREREVQYVHVEGDYTLPPGWGFVVAQGEVSADGRIASQARYFKPRTSDVVVTGNADLLLVR